MFVILKRLNRRDHDFCRTYYNGILVDANQMRGSMNRETLREIIPKGSGLKIDFNETARLVELRIEGNPQILIDDEKLPSPHVDLVPLGSDRIVRFGDKSFTLEVRTEM